jgi:N-acetylglutamate synthase-like GNAT family acetyltransferase
VKRKELSVAYGSFLFCGLAMLVISGIGILPMDSWIAGGLALLVGVPLALGSLAALIVGIGVTLRNPQEWKLAVLSAMSVFAVAVIATDAGSPAFFNTIPVVYGVAAIALSAWWFLVSLPRAGLIRRATELDWPGMLQIINDAAQAYKGVIPADRWHDPYFSAEELEREIAAGVDFWLATEGGWMMGLMGVQDKGDVALVRHAYVAPAAQKKGVGTRLLKHVENLAAKPVLIGTWAAATWAIDFYRRNGYALVTG